MTLRTIKIPYRIGRVCYATNSSSGINVTVECPDVKKAFRFLVKKQICVGDWIKFRGFARINMINKTTEERTEYYHNPNDGSIKSEWTYLKIDVDDFITVAPPEVLLDLKNSMDHVRRHIDSWAANSSSEDINKTLNVLSKTFNSLYKLLELQHSIDMENETKVTTIDIII